MKRLIVTVSLTFFLCIGFLLFNATSVSAAIVNFTGFETGTTLEAFTTGGTISLQSSVVRTANYALQVNSTTTGTGTFNILGLAGDDTGRFGNLNISTAYYTFYFRYATKPAANDEPIFRANDDASTPKFELRLDSDSQLNAYDSDLTLLSSGTTVLAADTWYLIEVKVGTGVTGAYEVKISGVSEYSGTGNLLATKGNSQFFLGKTTNRNGNTVDFYYDDFCVDNADYPGAGQLKKESAWKKKNKNNWK